jgi:hypothetical protein
MVKRAASTDDLFVVAESILLGLYDGGVLSPAVLQRVIEGFKTSDIDWEAACTRRSVDDKTLHEVVAMTLMPGRAIRNASKEFATIVAHIVGDAPAKGSESAESATANETNDALIDQLTGSSARGGAASRRKTPAKKAPPAGFNPLLRAAAPSRRGGTS